MTRQDTRLQAEGAEFLVLGNLLIEGVQAYKTYRYGRIVATCSADGFDIGANMVHTGWALAYRRYSKRYVAIEEKAKAANRGMWRGEFVPPWEWRRGKRLQEE